MSVSFHSNRIEIEKQVEEATKKSLRLVGGQAERFAKEAISDMDAVDTGFCKNSITFALDGEGANVDSYTDDHGEKRGYYSGIAPVEGRNNHCVYIGSNVYYAPYVEFGTTKMRARPFLGSSIENHQSEFERVFKEAFSHFR